MTLDSISNEGKRFYLSAKKIIAKQRSLSQKVLHQQLSIFEEKDS
jgi:hypothetical protein